MVGKDNPFSREREYYVFYDSTQGIADHTALMFNGYRIGQLKKLTMDENTGKIIARLEVFSKMKIPKGSKVKIESAILGTTTLKLILSKSTIEAIDGDTLLPEYTKDVMSMVNEKIAPIAAGADSLLANLNALIGRATVKKTFDMLPQLVGNLAATIEEIKNTITSIKPGVATTVDNLAAFSNNMTSYGKSLDNSLKSFEKLANQVDSIRLTALVNNLEQTIAALGGIASDIKNGKGTLGKLTNDQTLYNNLTEATKSIQCLVTDIKKYPEKYVPLLGSKKERKAAKAKSDLENCKQGASQN
jgi:phospholipid/cholesterol/gamma-HCH transport system substrate-binding protein